MRKIDSMTDQDFEDLFMNNFDCYADDGGPGIDAAMTVNRFLKVMKEITKEIKE